MGEGQSEWEKEQKHVWREGGKQLRGQHIWIVSSRLRFIPMGRHYDGERQRDQASEPGCGNVPGDPVGSSATVASVTERACSWACCFHRCLVCVGEGAGAMPPYF